MTLFIYQLWQLQNWIMVVVSVTYRYLDVKNSEKMLSIRHMLVCLYSSRTETLTMINLNVVCVNDSRIKWLDLTGSNFLDIANTGHVSTIKLDLKTGTYYGILITNVISTKYYSQCPLLY